MPARRPLMAKTPFQLDERPLQEASSPRAGVLTVSRAFRSLGIPQLIDQHIPLRTRRRGYSEAQMIESALLLQVVGGDCPQDMHLLAADQCLERGLGYQPPKATALREFLDRFHEPGIEQVRGEAPQQLSFIMPETSALQGLSSVQAGTVNRIASLYDCRGHGQRIATIDQDATIIESHNRAAYRHYEGGRGYQPMLAVWAEADLVVADEFRDGNVPTGQAPVGCCRKAFAALPNTVSERYFRGDSACYETELLQWLSADERAGEPGGRIGFAVSAVMSSQLAECARKVDEEQWETFDTDPDGTKRQWAELDFLPSQRSEHKDSRPLRYVGLRLLKPQGELFADGSDREHFAVATNLDWDAAALLEWHRLKAGTVEHVHDELKNGLAAGHMPSYRFAVNAAWVKLATLAYNICSAIKELCFDFEERTARFKRFRLLLIHVAGRMNRNNCVMRLRLAASRDTPARFRSVWEVFDLPTQATAAQPVSGTG